MESVKLQKTISCCGKSFQLEIATEMSIDSLDVRLECPSCRAKHAVNLESFIRNKAPESAQPSPQAGENPLSFMESSGGFQSESSSNESAPSSERVYLPGESSPLEELFKEEI